MTAERKIIDLANDCGINYANATYPCINFDAFSTFYHAVRNAALEEAAVKCDETREIEDHWDGGTTTVHKCFYRDDCIAAIRAMKDDGYGADNQRFRCFDDNHRY